MAITLKQAKNLKYGDMLHHVTLKNADGTSVRMRVTGKPKTWKKDLSRIKVPLKYGLYAGGELTNGTWEGNQFTVNLNEVEIA